MDFITNLLIWNHYNSIWIIINLFTKIVYFVPLEIDKKKFITLSASSFGIINDYTVYLKILFLIETLALHLGFKKISLNVLVLNPG